MKAPFLRAYTELLVRTCHKRGAHAIGGMAAFIPNRRDPDANETALRRVRDDKTREAADGSWVAHPDLVPVCREVFDSVLGERSDQRDRLREDVRVEAKHLLDVASTPGEITEDGLRHNISVGLQYLEAWLRGHGAVAIYGLMEDAATAEISRSQVWQWQQLAVQLDSGKTVTRQLVNSVIDDELAKIRQRCEPKALRGAAGATRPRSSAKSPARRSSQTSSRSARTTACLDGRRIAACLSPVAYISLRGVSRFTAGSRRRWPLGPLQHQPN
jgi:malate synthase